MDEKTLETFDESLARCNATPGFLDRFYDLFLASSPKVKEKFARTDFVKQKTALRESLRLMRLAATEGKGGPERHLKDLAWSHSRRKLDIGAELYDLWLDSLLAAVKECDPEFAPEIEEAWESIMMEGIAYLISRYHGPRQRKFR
jgi:hemoglobin-like flavoprotein